MAITFQVDTSQINRVAVRIAQIRDNFPGTLVRAMNYAAYDAQKDLQRQTPRFIDRPTAWTLRATFVEKATIQNMVVRLGFKDEASKGTPAARYLQPIVAGGPRTQKSSERQLGRRSVLFGGRFLIPTGKQPLALNAFGNLSGGQYTQVLSRIAAFDEAGYGANRSGSARSRRARSKQDYFIRYRGGVPIAIAARVGPLPQGSSASATRRRDAKGRFRQGAQSGPQGGRPATANLPRGFVNVFVFGKQPQYKPSFPVGTIVQGKFSERFPSIFERLVWNYKA